MRRSCRYATTDGSATLAHDDYAAGNGVLTFALGQTSRPIHVSVKGDEVAEANETFTVVLGNAIGAIIADDTGIGTVNNDDVATPMPTITPIPETTPTPSVTITPGTGSTPAITPIATPTAPAGVSTQHVYLPVMTK